MLLVRPALLTVEAVLRLRYILRTFLCSLYSSKEGQRMVLNGVNYSKRGQWNECRAVSILKCMFGILVENELPFSELWKNLI